MDQMHPFFGIVTLKHTSHAANKFTRNAGLLCLAEVLISDECIAAQKQDVAITNERQTIDRAI